MKSPMRKLIETILGVVLGNALLAFTVAAFMVPSGIIMGGATGVSLIISRFLPVQLSLIILAVNAVLFLLGAATLGKKFIVTTIASTFLYPLFLSVMQTIPGIDHLTENMMLCTVYGGALLGIGVGIIVRVGASTGGTDILALVLNKYLHVNVAVMMYIVDFTVLGIQVLFADAEQIMYGVIALVLMTFIMNRVMLMGQAQIQLFIITEKYEEVRERLLKEQDVGVTMVHVETGFGKAQQKAVLCITSHRKLYAINEMVHLIDEKAFLTISRINEVRGQGFTSARIKHEEAN